MIKSFERSLKKLSTDYVDLLLLRAGLGDASSAWRVLQRLYREELKEPALAQVSEKYGKIRAQIASSAWRVLQRLYREGLKEPALAQVSEKYGKTRAQIILRRLVQHGVCAIVNSASKERLLGNIDIFGFELADEDATQVEKLWRS